MIYEYTVYMPNIYMDRYSEQYFTSLSREERHGTYHEYCERLKEISLYDCFDEKASFDQWDLEERLDDMNDKYSRENPGISGDAALVLDCIAKACKLTRD